MGHCSGLPETMDSSFANALCAASWLFDNIMGGWDLQIALESARRFFQGRRSDTTYHTHRIGPSQLSPSNFAMWAFVSGICTIVNFATCFRWSENHLDIFNWRMLKINHYFVESFFSFSSIKNSILLFSFFFLTMKNIFDRKAKFNQIWLQLFYKKKQSTNLLNHS